jgi:hypothetical protein
MVQTGIEKQQARATGTKQSRNAASPGAAPTPDPQSCSENRIPGPTFEEIAELAYHLLGGTERR